ncbi:linalool dehydratase-isomerase precursor [Fusarium agapanthi]|uniref:Linalool dehydratase-isomerase n=1 Tax=Fusarium agapanthi TaxID=1803897 RepID=A0A9P5AW59_9HYPO|nr:linalool dehydratase-isomerase precursor [Fusarium agapanthi]
MGLSRSSAQHGQAYGTSGPYAKDLIPPNLGSGPHRKNVQARTLGVWIGFVIVSLGIFSQSYVNLGPTYRAAAVGLIFSGAGYLASANVVGGILFALTWASIPLALFAWFGAGAIIFPLLVWDLSILGVYFTTGDNAWENSGYWAPGTLFIARNEFILRQAAETDRLVAAASKREEDEEPSIESLRKLQFLFGLAFQSLDDWRYEIHKAWKSGLQMGCGPLRNFSRSLWTIIRNETVQFDTKTKEVSLTGLVGADKIDAGNYRSNEYDMYTQLAIGAGEYGDEESKEACVKKFEQAWGVKTAPMGSQYLDLENASCLMNQAALTAAIIRPGAYHRMIQKGPSETALRGPILSEVAYPVVLIAKARFHTSKDLELVLYPAADAGVFELGISLLTPELETKVAIFRDSRTRN